MATKAVAMRIEAAAMRIEAVAMRIEAAAMRIEASEAFVRWLGGSGDDSWRAELE